MAFLPAALAIAGPLIGGISGKIAGDKNAKRLRIAAADERSSGREDRARLREQVRSAIGEQLAAQASNGLEGGSGTALDALRQSQIEGALDALELRRQSEAKARSIETQARDAKRAGNFALLEGVIGAGSSAFKMKSDWAQERKADGGGYG
jgi:hypothetical protein